MKHLDLFSGIGGFALAARWLGIETIGFSEIDLYASAVLRKHWPNVPNHGDIRNIHKIDCDLITGGFPCQPFSCSGKRRGAADDRHLWPEMRRVIAESGPRWVLAENVPGIISMELDNVLSDLENEGYTCGTLVVPACAVDAPHKRERVWIVAHTPSEPSRSRRPERSQARPETPNSGEAVANPSIESSWGSAGSGLPGTGRTKQQLACVCEWKTEPNVGRVVDGLPSRVDRLKCLGNAIVPQVAFQLLQMITEIDSKLELA